MKKNGGTPRRKCQSKTELRVISVFLSYFHEPPGKDLIIIITFLYIFFYLILFFGSFSVAIEMSTLVLTDFVKGKHQMHACVCGDDGSFWALRRLESCPVRFLVTRSCHLESLNRNWKMFLGSVGFYVEMTKKIFRILLTPCRSYPLPLGSCLGSPNFL